jgi:hypothetical protein
MNNPTYFRREFMLPVKQLDAPKFVYISDGKSVLNIPIPVYGGVSIAEQELVDKITKEKGLGTVDPLIKTIADKVAPLNGGDPVKVATALINYKLGNRYPDPIADYRGYFLLNAETEFAQFTAAVDERKLDRWEYAACAHAMLSRVDGLTKLNEGTEWKTEDALDPKKLAPGHLLQLFNLYQLESSSADIEPYTNSANEFTWKPAKATDTPVVPAEKVDVEAIAGKS